MWISDTTLTNFIEVDHCTYPMAKVDLGMTRGLPYLLVLHFFIQLPNIVLLKYFKEKSFGVIHIVPVLNGYDLYTLERANKNLKAGVAAFHQDFCCIIPIITTLNSGALVETGRKLLVDSF